MTFWGAILSFAVVAGLLTVVPGLDTALVLRSALVQGTKLAFATSLGIGSGALLWGIFAALGVSAVLTASTVAYTCLRLAGAVYLVWMGVSLLRRSIGRELDFRASAGDPLPAGLSAWRAWRKGLLTNLLNPKIGAFYVAVLPQFLPPETSHLLMGILLALVHDAEGMLWFTILILGARRVRRWLDRRAAQRAVDGVTGAALVGFGVTLAIAS
jgi:threonine/homoserine/homoserine lactone efflux protein